MFSHDLYIEATDMELKSEYERQVKTMSKKGVLNIKKSNGKTIHHVEIGIKKPEKTQVLAARKMTLRDRILNGIFGDGHKMVVLVPAESVGTISITEMEVHEVDQERE